MKKVIPLIISLLLAIAVQAQTLNVVVGSVTYQFPAEQAGEMTYADGTTLTILNKAFTLSDITKMYIDDTTVTDNQVGVVYSGTSAAVTVAGNVAQYRPGTRDHLQVVGNLDRRRVLHVGLV